MVWIALVVGYLLAFAVTARHDIVWRSEETGRRDEVLSVLTGMAWPLVWTFYGLTGLWSHTIGAETPSERKRRRDRELEDLQIEIDKGLALIRSWRPGSYLDGSHIEVEGAGWQSKVELAEAEAKRLTQQIARMEQRAEIAESRFAEFERDYALAREATMKSLARHYSGTPVVMADSGALTFETCSCDQCRWHRSVAIAREEPSMQRELKLDW